MISSLYWPYLVADYYHALEIVSAVVAVVILLSSIDDLFIDAWYWVREAWRALTVKRRYQPLKAQQLQEVEEKPDRKSTRLNSSHQIISYAVFCLKKKK